MDAFFTGKKPRTKPVDSSSSKSLAAPKLVPWVEKYRPRTIEDVAHQEEVVAVLRNTVKGNEFPNLLFYGPPGTGKTSTILAVARQIFGNDLYKTRILELNASDERGIQVIRDKVKTFANQSVSNKRIDGTSCPPFKLVILDEADSMTTSAQAALRRTMEKQTKTTRFCLICNYVTRIIEPITSRCAKFRFKELPIDILQQRLKLIAEKESVHIDSEALSRLIDASEGDLRKAITFLQSAYRLRCGETITSRDVTEIAGLVPDSILDVLMTSCRSASFEKLDSAVKVLISQGYSAGQLLSQMHDKLVAMETLTDNQKSVIMDKLAGVDKCLCDGADEYLQIMALCTVIMDQICKHG